MVIEGPFLDDYRRWLEQTEALAVMKQAEARLAALEARTLVFEAMDLREHLERLREFVQ